MSHQHDDHHEDLPRGVILKEHSYDGIREYDQRLPRWWLLTLYGAVVFSIGYWFLNHQADSQMDVKRIEAQMAAIDALRLQNSIDVSNNDLFWEMAANSEFVAAGKKTFDSQCASCHGTNLQAGNGLIGVNLVDAEWIHGSQPSDIYLTVETGVLDKGMPTWGPVLGQRRIVEVVAYVLSQQAQ